MLWAGVCVCGGGGGGCGGGGGGCKCAVHPGVALLVEHRGPRTNLLPESIKYQHYAPTINLIPC